MSDDPHHNPCATCGRCCHSYVVPVSGEDIWRISTALRLSPAAYLVACPQKEPTPEGFRLQRDGPTYFLALDKRGPFGRHRPCVFLVRLGGGHERCGIYTHRPIVCRTYPMQFRGGVISERSASLCPPNSWPAAVVQRPAWREQYLQQRQSFDVHSLVVARWNARVAAGHPEQIFRMHEFSSYLLNAYDQLDQLRQALGPVSMAAVAATWGQLPPGLSLDGPVQLRGDELLWLRYVTQARAIVERFYPAVPSSPLLPWLLRDAAPPDMDGESQEGQEA